jgi:hypothetical protein
MNAMGDRLDDMMQEAAREYNEPPQTPRGVMWQRIVAARAAEATEKAEKGEKADAIPVLPLRPLRNLRPLRLAAGIAALLALGIGLGRLSVDRSPVAVVPAPVVNQAAPPVSAAAYHFAATEHLSQSEAFLTLFRASLRGTGGNERLAGATARQLLATNRLLLDSPAANDAKTRLLLQDLELVLAEIAQLSPQSRSRDLDLITEGLERSGVMSRLRTAVPSGPGTTQGAL